MNFATVETEYPRFPALRQLARRPSEKLLELWYGIKTSGWIPAKAMALPPDGYDYAPVPYLVLFAMLRSLPRELRSGALVDFGSGKGRILAVAGRLYRRVEGVEYSPELCAEAYQNTRNLPNVTIDCCDAAEYSVPDDATVFFFASPFGVPIMEKVQDAIYASLQRNPRDAAFLVYNRRYFDAAAEKRPWIVKLRHIACHPDASWSLYRVKL